ncbi:unannotated protein [freshwater metagenome]|uniref:Unannotated protein n=1 Tax=freshwater metagenome TaxID=449393 RepID=A0A6J6DKT0_9ZZZZ|nr:hypothetical protein [Actinomycetota bacterium]
MSSSDRPVVEIVGLGPAGSEHVSRHTLDRIAAHRHRWLRTAVHPSAVVVGDAATFDDLYESADSFDDVYSSIVERLVQAAREHGEILYAVPGSPLILERTVRALIDDERIRCVVNPAMGFLEMAWSRLGIDPVEEKVTLIDGHTFAASAAGVEGPMLVAHCHANWVLSEIKLSAEDTVDASNDDDQVVILHHLGLPDEQVLSVRWSELDRTVEADHLTSIYVPALTVPVGSELVSFHRLARTLRERCPWDREQTHRSLVTYLLEETHEVVDAILALDPDDPSTDEHLAEELGDLLYQIEFHAAIAEEEGRFTMGDVARGINDKLVRRHPHVFGGETGDDLVASWDAIKKAEKREKGISDGPFDGIPSSSGSLAYAAAVLKKAAKAGLHIEVAPLPPGLDLELGELLLAVVAECRRRGLDPEVVLRDVTNVRRRNAETPDTR